MNERVKREGKEEVKQRLVDGNLRLEFKMNLKHRQRFGLIASIWDHKCIEDFNEARI